MSTGMPRPLSTTVTELSVCTVTSMRSHFFFSSRRRHTRWTGDRSSDVCSSDLWAALVVAFVAASSQALVKLALDSTVQREIGEDIRSSTFAVSETLNQLSWVIGGLIGVALSLTSSGIAGLSVAAAGLAIALALLLAGRRNRIANARRMAPQTP